MIDVHTHAWPDRVAERALAGSFDDLERFGDGKVDSLLAKMDAAGIDRAVNLGVAPTPEYVEGVNRFLGTLDRERFVGFGSIHAELSPEENLASLRANRLCGVKIHPLFQHYRLDHPGLLKTLKHLQGEFVALMHVGAGGEESADNCTPAMVADLVERFPDLDIIACHFGGYRMLTEAEETVIGLPVYVDTAWPPTLTGVESERLVEVIRRHGTDRVLFGSDWPMADPAAELAAVRDLGLDAEETAAITGRNMKKLLNIYEKEG